MRYLPLRYRDSGFLFTELSSQKPSTRKGDVSHRRAALASRRAALASLRAALASLRAALASWRAALAPRRAALASRRAASEAFAIENEWIVLFWGNKSSHKLQQQQQQHIFTFSWHSVRPKLSYICTARKGKRTLWYYNCGQRGASLKETWLVNIHMHLNV